MRLGVVGFGRRMSSLVNHSMRAVEPDLRVTGIVDPDEQGARERLAEIDRTDIRFYETLDEMVRQGKLDALAIGTRCDLHTPYATQAAQHDLPLFLEKPVSNSMDQAIALETAFEKSNCPVVVSFPLRVSPLCVLAREYIEQGAIGHPEHVLASNYVPYGTAYFAGHYRDYAVTQGLFIQKATHDFDYLMYLMGSNIVRVAAMACWGRVFGGSKPAGLRCSECDESQTCPESSENRKRYHTNESQGDHLCVFGSDVGIPQSGMNEDSSSALLEFASGAHGTYAQVFYSKRDAAERGATVSGYDGTLSFDWYKSELTRVRHHKPFSDTVKEAAGLDHFGGDAELAYDFVAVVKGESTSRTPIWAGIQSIYSCLAAKESSHTGQFVRVRQVGQTGA